MRWSEHRTNGPAHIQIVSHEDWRVWKCLRFIRGQYRMTAVIKTKRHCLGAVNIHLAQLKTEVCSRFWHAGRR